MNGDVGMHHAKKSWEQEVDLAILSRILTLVNVLVSLLRRLLFLTLYLPTLPFAGTYIFFTQLYWQETVVIFIFYHTYKL